MSATFAGIRTGHSRPCHPQTNGREGPCHRFLKAEALSGPPFDNLAQAKAALAKWRHLHNTEPPHEALGLAVPIDRYKNRTPIFAMRSCQADRCLLFLAAENGFEANAVKPIAKLTGAQVLRCLQRNQHS